jgi:diguanylate cyclase (GGDEF)-like protein
MSDIPKPSRPPLVLVADDQEWSARSLESILGPRGYAVLRAYTGRQALELARSAQPDLVLLDVRMPDLDGIEVCRLLREEPTFSAHTPVIMVTSGPADRAQMLAALQAGAWDYVASPIDGEAMLAKLDTYMRSKRETDRIREESLLDQFTGLYNIRGLARRAREIGADAYRHHESLSCVAFTAEPVPVVLSRETINELGAQVAAHLSAVFRRTGRVSDAIGRLGQQEFAIIAPCTEARGATRLLQRLQESLEAEPIMVSGTDRKLRIRASYCSVPDYAESSVDAVEMLLRAATALRQNRGSEEETGPAIWSYEKSAEVLPS